MSYLEHKIQAVQHWPQAHTAENNVRFVMCSSSPTTVPARTMKSCASITVLLCDLLARAKPAYLCEVSGWMSGPLAYL